LEKAAQATKQNETGLGRYFLESTALFQLGSKLQIPEFAKLIERQQYLKFDLLVSEVLGSLVGKTILRRISLQLVASFLWRGEEDGR
jgi:hypothetical protein